MIFQKLGSWCGLLLVFWVESITSICPDICYCYPENLVDCSSRSLRELPENLSQDVVHLDLSNNLFDGIPKGFADFPNLSTLEMSHNFITRINPDDFSRNTNLKTINLRNNNIASWELLSNSAFAHMANLTTLLLDNNHFGDFGDVADRFLMSNSLTNLSLSNCSIQNLHGNTLTGLPSIITLNLSLNNITTLNVALKSETLVAIDLSNTGLHRIYNPFEELTSLQKLKLADNNHLKSFYGKSSSLLFLDATHCGLDALPRGSFTRLKTAIFKENHMRVLPPFALNSMPDIQEIDISYNTIRSVDEEAFSGAKNLKYVDLSFNTISEISPKTFSSNFRLTLLRLSHNYLREVVKFDSESLKGLVLSNCEISSFQRDSLTAMTSLEYLSLANNPIRAIPEYAEAEELRTLDMSMCMVSRITNTTFVAMPKLRKLLLKGNRLTSGIRPSFFYEVTELYLHDNSWRCECTNRDFRDLYYWLTGGDVQTNIYDLVCQSPEYVQGYKWGVACYEEWNSRSDKAWMYSIILLLMLVVFFCVILSIKRSIRIRARRERTERQQNIAEARERLQRMRDQEREARSSENMNAPDPRELERPPTYNEALTMPKLTSSQGSLIGSHGSLHGSSTDLKSGRKKRRRRRQKSASQEDVRPKDTTTDYSSENEQSYRIYMESDV